VWHWENAGPSRFRENVNCSFRWSRARCAYPNDGLAGKEKRLRKPRSTMATNPRGEVKSYSLVKAKGYAGQGEAVDKNLHFR
jgi:hypothetical protein